MRIILSAVVFLVASVSFSAAQDAVCDRNRDKTHKAVCNCHVSNGGWARQESNGRIRWGMRGGGGNMALQNCLAKYQS